MNSTARSIAQLRAALDRLEHGGVRDLEKHRQELLAEGLQELHQQFQIPVHGKATNDAIWSSSIRLTFDVEFYEATEQRDAPFTLPTYTYGVVLTTGLVFVSPLVLGFVTPGDGRRSWTGCFLQIGVHAPGTDIGDVVDYSGYVHLNFQGFGAPTDNVSTIDVGT